MRIFIAGATGVLGRQVVQKLVAKGHKELLAQRQSQFKKWVLVFDGAFLLLAGAIQIILELTGHFFQAGPYATIFGDSPYIIGFAEAHGLAVLMSLLFFRAALVDPTCFWHGFAAAVHVLLGGANLLFWDTFVALDLVRAGVIATALHILLVVLQSTGLFLSGRGHKHD